MDIISSRKRKKYELLTKESQINVDAYIVATQKWIRNAIKNITYITPTKCEKSISIKIKNQILTRIRNQEIYKRVVEDKEEDYWTKRLKWTKETKHKVYWEAISIATKTTKKSIWSNMVKMASEQITIAHKLHQRKQRESNICPYCGKK